MAEKPSFIAPRREDRLRRRAFPAARAIPQQRIHEFCRQSRTQAPTFSSALCETPESSSFGSCRKDGVGGGARGCSTLGCSPGSSSSAILRVSAGSCRPPTTSSHLTHFTASSLSCACDLLLPPVPPSAPYACSPSPPRLLADISSLLRRALLSESESGDGRITAEPLPTSACSTVRLRTRQATAHCCNSVQYGAISDATLSPHVARQLGSSHGLMDHHGKASASRRCSSTLPFRTRTASRRRTRSAGGAAVALRPVPPAAVETAAGGVQRLASAAAQSHSNALNRMARIDITRRSRSTSGRPTSSMAVPAAQEAEVASASGGRTTARCRRC